MYASKYIFSKQFFTGWVTVGIIWIFGSFGAVVIYPAWESRRTVLNVLRLLFTGKKPGHVETHTEKDPYCQQLWLLHRSQLTNQHDSSNYFAQQQRLQPSYVRADV